MTTQTMSQEQLYQMAGVKPVPNSYTPASIGKLGKQRPYRNTFVANVKNITYRNPAELRAQTPEHVSWFNPLIPYETEEGVLSTRKETKYRAIVGDKTKHVYSVMSNRYNPVQHSTILEAMAQASEDMGVNVFGSVSDIDGKLHAHGFFVSPELDLSKYANRVMHNDPFMLGVRVFNSHDGQTGFGAEIFGIRMLCFNYNAFGYSLGKVGWKHRVENDDIVSNFAGVINNVADEVPMLANYIARMDSNVITIDEATALLYGISLTPLQAETITDKITLLNPETRDKKKITVYDLYNSATAYISHRSAGGNMIDGTIDLSHKIEKIMYKDTDELLTLGFKRKEKEDERVRQLEVNKNTTKVVMPKGW